MELSVEHLRFAYSLGKKVLDEVSFKAGSGDFISLIGKNGSGKSTLFKCILNRLPNYEGAVFVNGRDSRRFSKKELSECFAYVPQACQSVFDYSVMDMVLMGTARGIGRYSSPSEEQVQIARDALDAMEIGHLAEKNINRISGGERQLAYIARALAQQSKVILMDEPTSALDFSHRYRVLDHAKKLARKGYVIIMTTHDPSVPFSHGSKVLALKEGKLMAFGEPDKVLTEELLGSLYGEKIRIGEINGNRVLYREVVKT